MTAPVPHARYAMGEYLRLEEHSNVKHEFLDGQIFAMAGGTLEHAAIAASLTRLLAEAVRDRRCRVYTSDARVRVLSSGLCTYPDVTVACGSEERDSEDPHALVNPIVLVEVTSDSSADYDRGAKLDHYKTIPALREAVIVSHRENAIEVWSRDDLGVWSSLVARAGGTVVIASLDCVMRVDEVYRNPFGRRILLAPF